MAPKTSHTKFQTTIHQIQRKTSKLHPKNRSKCTKNWYSEKTRRKYRGQYIEPIIIFSYKISTPTPTSKIGRKYNMGRRRKYIKTWRIT